MVRNSDEADQQAFQRGACVRTVGALERLLGTHDQVYSAEPCGVVAECFAHQPLDAIAPHRAFVDLLGCDDAQAGMTQIIGPRPYLEEGIRLRTAQTKNG